MTTRLTIARAIGAALLLAGGAVLFSAAPAYADPPAGQICPDLDSGKIDVPSNPEVKSITITVDDGFVITEVCVKAGAGPSGGGAVIIPVDPPSQTFTFEHPTGKGISHYSYSFEPAPTPTPSPSETPTEIERRDRADSTRPRPVAVVDSTAAGSSLRVSVRSRSARSSWVSAWPSSDARSPDAGCRLDPRRRQRMPPGRCE